MSHRIKLTFDTARNQNRAALITFIMGGDPSMDITSSLLEALPGAGADIIEVGVPFSDPMADGPVIEAAGKRSILKHTGLPDIIAAVKKFRAGNDKTPIILMGYYNPIYRYGVSKFCKDAVEAGIDGLIIVDLPPEEEQEIRPYLAESELCLIRLIAPTSSQERIEKITKSASGFVYYISITGITGAASASPIGLKEKLASLKEHTPIPVAVGFGIKTAEQVKEIGAMADAVVVGSALVAQIAGKNKEKAVAAATDFVRGLTPGLRK